MGIGRQQAKDECVSAPLQVFWQVTNVLGASLLVVVYGTLIALVTWSISTAALCTNTARTMGFTNGLVNNATCEFYNNVDQPLGLPQEVAE